MTTTTLTPPTSADAVAPLSPFALQVLQRASDVADLGCEPTNRWSPLHDVAVMISALEFYQQAFVRLAAMVFNGDASLVLQNGEPRVEYYRDIAEEYPRALADAILSEPESDDRCRTELFRLPAARAYGAAEAARYAANAADMFLEAGSAAENAFSSPESVSVGMTSLALHDAAELGKKAIRDALIARAILRGTREPEL